MCEEFNAELLAKIPIDPELLKASDQGKCIVKEFPERSTSKALIDIAEKVKKFSERENKN
jgi:MinD-like ATPase involved in chromosome partitioning or flagellar assembly